MPRTSGEKCRIHKYLATCGIASRRGAEAMIRAGRVKLNGTVVTRLGTLCDPATDSIEVDGHRARPPRRHVYLAVNKPRGHVSTVRDRHAEHLVVDLAPPKFRPRLKPVGRLDKDSEGLLLLSDDGPFIHRLTHPRYHVEKEYRVAIAGPVAPTLPEALTEGVELDDGTARALAAEFIQRSPRGATLRIVLGQGRKRQIRRMIEALGCRVVSLRRVRIGPVRLGRLAKGEWRHLTKAEVGLLYDATGTKKRPHPGKQERS